MLQSPDFLGLVIYFIFYNESVSVPKIPTPTTYPHYPLVLPVHLLPATASPTCRKKIVAARRSAAAAAEDVLRSTLIFDILYKSLILNAESNFKRKLNYEYKNKKSEACGDLAGH